MEYKLIYREQKFNPHNEKGESFSTELYAPRKDSESTYPAYGMPYLVKNSYSVYDGDEDPDITYGIIEVHQESAAIRKVIFIFDSYAFPLHQAVTKWITQKANGESKMMNVLLPDTKSLDALINQLLEK